MSVLPAFAHHRATSIDDVLGRLSFDDVPYAGGTELLLAMKAGLFRPDSLIDLKRVPELASISADGDGVVIGGSVTHRDAHDDPTVREHLAVLASVLSRVGNPRVRASGTLGGNLCFAEPKSDVATILIALGATVTLRSVRGTRTIPVEEFVIGPYTTVRDDDELLTGIRVPYDRSRAVYVKFQTMERPTVGVACSAGPSVRLVVGAVGGGPHLVEVETLDSIDPHAVAAEVEVVPDLTGSERYKRHVTRVYVERAIEAMEATT